VLNLISILHSNRFANVLHFRKVSEAFAKVFLAKRIFEKFAKVFHRQYFALYGICLLSKLDNDQSITT